MSLTQSEFVAALARFRQVNPLSVKRSTSRIEEVMPRLSVQRAGRYSTITGLDALARHTNRQEDYVRQFFIEQTSGVLEKVDDARVVLRGHIAIRDVRRFENNYLRQKVLCAFCKSPDTQLKDHRIECKNCNRSRADVLENK